MVKKKIPVYPLKILSCNTYTITEQINELNYGKLTIPLKRIYFTLYPEVLEPLLNRPIYS